MTDKEIRRYAHEITNVATVYMPRAVEDALDETQLDDLLQAIYSAVVRELERVAEEVA